MNLVKLLELVRYSCAGFGFFLAYQPNLTSEATMYYLILWIVIPLAGLTGIESICFPTESALSKNREVGSAYQIQSGMNNLAIAITGAIVWFWQWGASACMAVLFVLYIFFALSSMNHLFEFITKKPKTIIHLVRPLLTIILIMASVPILLQAFR